MLVAWNELLNDHATAALALRQGKRRFDVGLLV